MKKLGLISVIVLIINIWFLAVSTSCEPDRQPYTIQNNTGTPIEVWDFIVSDNNSAHRSPVWVSNTDMIIDPGQTRTFIGSVRNYQSAGNYIICAITDNSDVIYSHYFTWNELRDMGWRVVIAQN
jgi:hypothetical protein